MDILLWTTEFTDQLQTQLQLTAADIRFPWANFRIQGYSPSEAIAYLIATHRLYPELRLLPMPAPKFGIGDAVVWHGEGDVVVSMRWWQSLDKHWSYQTANSFGLDSMPNVWFEEKGLSNSQTPEQESCRRVA